MKKYLRKITAIVLILTLCLGLAACGEKKEDPAPVDPGQAEELTRQTDDLVEPEVSEELDEDPNRAIVRGSKPILQHVTGKVDGTPLDGGSYLYRSLLTGEAQQAYDLIRAGLVEGAEKITMSVPIKTTDLSTIYKYVCYDSPDLFWVDGGYTYYRNNSNIVTKVVPKYNGLVKDIAGNTAKMEQALADPLAKMWSMANDVARVKFAHDYIVSNVGYGADSVYNQSAYSAVIEGVSVCAGYSRTFQYMMQKVGIPCAYVTGYAWDETYSGAHAWNLVLLNGEYYAIDVTWDDPLGAAEGKFYYDYFNVTDTQLAADHQRDNISAVLPAASGTKASFQEAFAGNAYGTDFASITGTLPEGYGKGAGFVGAEDSDGKTSNPYLD